MSPEELITLKRGIGRPVPPAAIRAAAASFGVPLDDVLVLLQLAALVAKDTDDSELSRFLRTGRLPDLVALTPRQMEYVRGGRLTLTATRGLAPATILSTLCRDP